VFLGVVGLGCFLLVIFICGSSGIFNGYYVLEEFDVFKRLEKLDYSVFLDKNVLSLNYVPKKLVSREEQDLFFSTTF